MKPDREVIDVRADERFDAARLEPWLRERLPGTQGPLQLAQFGGGHANLTYLISFGATEYVLRRPPLGPVAPSSHDMSREHRVLKDLWQVFPLAPRSYVMCEDESIIGAPFHVMERRHGIAIRTKLPAGYDWTPELNARVGNMAIDVLSKLHCVDPADAGLGGLGRPEGFVKRQLSGWSKRWEAAKHEDSPAMGAIISWLERGLRRDDTVTLLHNDYKLDNLLVDAVDPARAAAVLDWDMCTRGDPLMDLGYALTFWGEAGDDQSWIDAASMPTWNPGFPTREDVIERYARATGFDCGHVHWYHVFGVFKIAVVLQQIYIRFLRGQTRDERFSVFGERVAALIDKGKALAKL
ncbi:MAG: phosphotransferase family protein [Proteobacteria bacterium]|nr:phosphotransferase family protein [Pseudomonadota bacterium]